MEPKLTSFNHFRLFALGHDFNVDSYVLTSPLKFSQVWYRGVGNYKSNGVEIELGDGRILSTLEQEQVAARFLAENSKALHELGHRSDVTTFTIGIHYRHELHPKCEGFNLSPDKMLVTAAALLNAEVTYYIVFDRVEPRRLRR